MRFQIVKRSEFKFGFTRPFQVHNSRHYDMVRSRTRTVARAGGGRVGYLHLPDMERTGYSEFWRHYAAEVRRGALLVDLRGNIGGRARVSAHTARKPSLLCLYLAPPVYKKHMLS